jgi:hypothetical protein
VGTIHPLYCQLMERKKHFSTSLAFGAAGGVTDHDGGVEDG